MERGFFLKERGHEKERKNIAQTPFLFSFSFFCFLKNRIYHTRNGLIEREIHGEGERTQVSWVVYYSGDRLAGDASKSLLTCSNSSEPGPNFSLSRFFLNQFSFFFFSFEVPLRIRVLGFFCFALSSSKSGQGPTCFGIVLVVVLSLECRFDRVQFSIGF